MIVDTSAWVEYLRRTESPTHLALRAEVEAGRPIATPAAAAMELLAGCCTEPEALKLSQLLSRFEVLVPDSAGDFQHAAFIHRTCRRAGYTIRSIVACLVAAAAIQVQRPLLARNRDFEVIARHTGLELVVPRSSC